MDRHPQAGIFHTPAWLECLRAVYRYAPVVYTTTPPGRALEDGVVLCRVASRLTGRRLVSLPFSDHCQPLLGDPDRLAEICAALREERKAGRWSYVELRPAGIEIAGAGNRTASQPARLSAPEASHWGQRDAFLHVLDLAPDLDSLFKQCHNTAIRQAVRRAEREGVELRVGRDAAVLRPFLALMLMTRRKHKLPPPPEVWFYTLAEKLGDHLQVWLALLSGVPIASILTLSYRGRHYYKYSCFDLEYRNVGGTPFLLWNAIRQAREAGGRDFDLGRSDADNEGLVTFKDRWGAQRTCLTYLRCSSRKRSDSLDSGWKMNLAQEIFSRLPDRLLVLAGNFLYRHIG